MPGTRWQSIFVRCGLIAHRHPALDPGLDFAFHPRDGFVGNLHPTWEQAGGFKPVPLRLASAREAIDISGSQEPEGWWGVWHRDKFAAL
jgi:hypothetical protein